MSARVHNGRVTTYLAFLRAINLGAKRVFPKEAIRAAAEAAGFEHVATHINTGNVRFETRLRSRAKIEDALEHAFLADRGFDVPTIAFSAAEFSAIAAEGAELDAAHPGPARHYVYFLKAPLEADRAAAVEATASAQGQMVVRGRAVHALLAPGYQDGVVDPLRAAKLLGVTTSRAMTVVSALAAKWC